MKVVVARHRHRAHFSITAAAAIAALAVGCGGGSVPTPKHVQVRAEDYVAVPYSPRPPPVEILPARPSTPSGLVWADGGWDWDGERFRWLPGGWVAPPVGAVRARWVIIRRTEDGQLFFAPSTWRDASGKTIDAPPPVARAQTRPGGAAGAVDPVTPGGGRTDLDD
jgi:hypothetical protein